MKESGYYPCSAEFDPKAPYNEPLSKKVRVEVGVELGLFVDIEIYNEDEIEDAVKEVLKDKFKTEDIEINNITIWNHDFPSKWE